MKQLIRSLTISTFLLMTSAPLHAAAPDLLLSSVINKTASVAPGGTVKVVITVKNMGDATASKSSVGVYLSEDAIKSAGDIRLTGTLQVAALGRGKASTETKELTVPANSKAGSYYIIAAADDRKQVKESREGNNTRKATTKVKVKTPVKDGFALIPAGNFEMGDQSNPLVGYRDELPVHTVYVSAFYMGKYEVTKELWDEVRAWGLNHGYADLSAGDGKAANHPVHSISWYDMVKWCNARSEKENLIPCYTVRAQTYKSGENDAVVCDFAVNGYRLPTEAEWEKAARGGTVGKNFPWGTDTISHQQANYYSLSSYSYDVSPTRGHHSTYAVGSDPYSSPVGSFAPNGYGLYDLAGNMAEWCWDWFWVYTAGSQTDPRGSNSGSDRVFRGGSWSYDAYYCRAAYRAYYSPGGTSLNIGFRVARSSLP